MKNLIFFKVRKKILARTTTIATLLLISFSSFAFDKDREIDVSMDQGSFLLSFQNRSISDLKKRKPLKEGFIYSGSIDNESEFKLVLKIIGPSRKGSYFAKIESAELSGMFLIDQESDFAYSVTPLEIDSNGIPNVNVPSPSYQLLVLAGLSNDDRKLVLESLE